MNFTDFNQDDRFILGVDPGQARDPTAICITRVIESERPVHQVVHLERLPLRTPYPGIGWRVNELLQHPLLNNRTDVVLDLTGVGRPVHDLFEDQGISAIGVTITTGHEQTQTDRDHWSVPKLTLISTVLSLLHDDRLHIAADLPESRTLVAEFEAFHGSHTDTGAWRFGARSGQHDDLVLALCLCCWGARANDKLKDWYRIAAQLGPQHPVSEESEPDLEPGPGEVVVTVRQRVWCAAENRWLQPGRQLMSVVDAAHYASWLV